MTARQKRVPSPPDDLADLFEVREAVPLTPEPETSCCVLLVRRTAVPARDDAKTWLTFLRGLGLVEETDRGYVRTRTRPSREELGERFLAGTYGARELRATLETAGPLDAAAAFERFRDHVPAYERQRAADWERTWRERVDRLLSWGVLVGVFDRDEDGYRLAPDRQGGSRRSDRESRR